VVLTSTADKGTPESEGNGMTTDALCERCGQVRRRTAKIARFCIDCAIDLDRQRGKPPPSISTAELWRKYKAGELVERER
jgi:hypothetical protein